jgi:hypothetical protein
MGDNGAALREWERICREQQARIAELENRIDILEEENARLVMAATVGEG